MTLSLKQQAGFLTLEGSEKSGRLGVKFTGEVTLPILLLWFSYSFGRVPFSVALNNPMAAAGFAGATTKPQD
jgi:hypothetical protein